MEPETRLVAAVKSGDLAAARAALRAGAPPDSRHEHEESWDRERISGDESVLQLAARGGHVEIVAALLAHGADPDARDTLRGRSPLVEAAALGEARIVALLLGAGATIDADEARPHRDALAAAIEGGHAQVAEALLRAGAVATARALELACLRGDPALVAACRRGGASAADPQALLAAARGGDVATLRALVAPGADLATTGGEALCEAANAGKHAAVAYLLSVGAPHAFRNSYGWPPLHFAAYQADAALCELLLRAGADPRATDSAGRTAASWAEEAGKAENVAVLARALRTP